MKYQHKIFKIYESIVFIWILLLKVLFKISIAWVAISFGRTFKIINSEDAIPGEFPYQVSIQTFRTQWMHMCGGSILNEYYVLTAGHCVLNYNIHDLKVFAGKHHISRNEDTQQIVELEKVIIHPKYPEYVSIIFNQK